MKQKFFSMMIALLMAMPMMAQSENAMQNVSVTDLTYMIKEQPKSELGTVVGAVLETSLSTAPSTTSPRPVSCAHQQARKTRFHSSTPRSA